MTDTKEAKTVSTLWDIEMLKIGKTARKLQHLPQADERLNEVTTFSKEVICIVYQSPKHLRSLMVVEENNLWTVKSEQVAPFNKAQQKINCRETVTKRGANAFHFRPGTTAEEWGKEQDAFDSLENRRYLENKKNFEFNREARFFDKV